MTCSYLTSSSVFLPPFRFFLRSLCPLSPCELPVHPWIMLMGTKLRDQLATAVLSLFWIFLLWNISDIHHRIVKCTFMYSLTFAHLISSVLPTSLFFGSIFKANPYYFTHKYTSMFTIDKDLKTLLHSSKILYYLKQYLWKISYLSPKCLFTVVLFELGSNQGS